MPAEELRSYVRTHINGNRPCLTVCSCDQIQFPFQVTLKRFYSITPSPFVMLTQTCSTLPVHRWGWCEQVGTNEATVCLPVLPLISLIDCTFCPVQSGTCFIPPQSLTEGTKVTNTCPCINLVRHETCTQNLQDHQLKQINSQLWKWKDFCVVSNNYIFTWKFN